MIGRHNNTKPDYQVPLEGCTEFKTHNNLGPGINQLRQILEGMKISSQTRSPLTSVVQNRGRLPFVEADYQLNTSNLSVKLLRNSNNNSTVGQKKKAQGKSIKVQTGIKLVSNHGPLIINTLANTAKKSLLASPSGYRFKNEEEEVQEKPVLLGSHSYLNMNKKVKEVAEKIKEPTISYNHRFNFSLKKNSKVHKKIKKGVDDQAKISMIIDLRNSVQITKKEKLSPDNISDDLLQNIDSSIEKEPRNIAYFKEVAACRQESTAVDSTLIKRTEGSLSNMSKSNLSSSIFI